ncbi:thiamine phosphate synthase [Enhygromyxa salina]|uniref:Thiamine-phosphate pyrophosphorylase n=1 Tax=Enhygromyxa salina TaxID=215803 RepID=A0A2S9YXZ3_9BACT|nr:thiamine phosphate synthase [Enhygromyxa salina]PRQ09929.1 thiamine-phosphate pyrophosphorylase [Enhygromyxa salina]
MRLLAITPPAALAPTLDPAVVDSWLQAGADALGLAVLLREPGASAATILADPRLLALRHALAVRGVPALVSVDPTALELEPLLTAAPALAGIQLRGDPAPELCERWRVQLPGMTIGRSVHGATPTPNRFVDYTCLAPIFPPHTVQAGVDKRAIGLDALRSWTAVCGDVIALGGVTPANADACLAAGARGVAGIRLFFARNAEARDNVGALRQVFSLRESPGPDDHGSQAQRRG